MTSKYFFTKDNSTTTIALSGRNAWALSQLIKAGKTGCTPISRPAPRWSAYVHNLRSVGFCIETIHEPHAGPFPGTHARYVLRSNVRAKLNV
ncbi:MAG: hypothetical protein P1V21_11635 [Rhizobiaceae bacterium]|nr:hypothetical protein [Rhizobiaceae bacterium]